MVTRPSFTPTAVRPFGYAHLCQILGLRPLPPAAPAAEKAQPR